MSEQLTYLTGLMQLFLGVLGGGCIVWLFCRARKNEIIVYKRTIRMYERNGQADQNLIKLLQSRLAGQKKLYQAKKNDVIQHASTTIQRLEHIIQNLRNLKGFLK